MAQYFWDFVDSSLEEMFMHDCEVKSRQKFAKQILDNLDSFINDLKLFLNDEHDYDVPQAYLFLSKDMNNDLDKAIEYIDNNKNSIREIVYTYMNDSLDKTIEYINNNKERIKDIIIEYK